jgi:hypothetical protein
MKALRPYPSAIEDTLLASTIALVLIAIILDASRLPMTLVITQLN